MTTQITTENYYTTLSQLPRNHIYKIIQKITKNHDITIGQLSKITNIPESSLNKSNNRTLNFYQFKTLANFENKTVNELMFNYLNEPENSEKINIINQEDERKIYEDFKDKLEPYMIQNYFDYLVLLNNLKKIDIAKELQISNYVLSMLKRKFHDYNTMNKIAKYFDMSLNDFLTKAYQYDFNKTKSDKYITNIRKSIKTTGFENIKNYIQNQLKNQNKSMQDFFDESGLNEYNINALKGNNWNYDIFEKICEYFNQTETEFLQNVIQNPKENVDKKINEKEFFKNQLQTLIDQRNMSKMDLSKLTGISSSTIKSWLGPNPRIASDKNIEILSIKLGVPINYFSKKEITSSHTTTNQKTKYENIKKGLIYQNILTVVHRNNKTIQWLSEQTKIPYGTIIGWRKRNPKEYENIKLIAKTLNVDINELLSKPKKPSNLPQKTNYKYMVINKDLYPNMQQGQIYRNILNELHKQNLSMKWLHNQLNSISYQTMTAWYRATWPKNINVLNQIAKILDIDVKELLVQNENTNTTIKPGELYDNIRKLCQEKNITIENLAIKSNVPLKTIKNWKTRKEPAEFETVEKIANTLNITVEQLYDGLESEKFNINIKPVLINEKDLFQKIENLTHDKSDFEKAFIKTQIKNTIQAIYG